MPTPKSLDDWLQPSSSKKRKRPTTDYANTKDSGKGNIDEAPEVKQSEPPKQSKPSQSTSKANTDAKKLYAATLKAIDKRVNELDRKAKEIWGNSYEITTDTYAEAMQEHFAAAKRLVEMDETLAFNLLLSMADASHSADLDTTAKMCGVGDSEPIFEWLDRTLLPLIEKRVKSTPDPANMVIEVEVQCRWAETGENIKTLRSGRLNKQQINALYRQKFEWEKERREARRKRREDAQNWITVALSDLKEERDYLAEYGVENYLPKSIAKLEELMGL